MAYSASEDKGNVNRHIPRIDDIPTHPAIDILDWCIDNQLGLKIDPVSPEYSDVLGSWRVEVSTHHWTPDHERRSYTYWGNDLMTSLANARAGFRKMAKDGIYDSLDASTDKPDRKYGF